MKVVGHKDERVKSRTAFLPAVEQCLSKDLARCVLVEQAAALPRTRRDEVCPRQASAPFGDGHDLSG